MKSSKSPTIWMSKSAKRSKKRKKGCKASKSSRSPSWDGSQNAMYKRDFMTVSQNSGYALAAVSVWALFVPLLMSWSNLL